MLLMGFRNEVEDIINETPKDRQTLCFSATIDSEVKSLAYKYMKDAVSVSAPKETVTLPAIKQQVVETTDRKKQDALCSVLDQDRPFMAIIFCRTKVRVDKLEEAMHERGYDCVKLHSDIQQSKRERIMKSFRKGDIQYLIATDVAARGLDISGVSHIYNYDIPENPESYIHRIGRTGRAGEEGYTCMFAAQKDMKTLDEIEQAIGFRIERRIIAE
jgi:superfamily II DNA/RNA helicase